MTPIKIGQIGVGHEHAAGKMEAFRQLAEVYEVVGVVEEESPAWRSGTAYEGLARLTEDELLHTPGLQAVAVETNNHEVVSCAPMSTSIASVP